MLIYGPIQDTVTGGGPNFFKKVLAIHGPTVVKQDRPKDQSIEEMPDHQKWLKGKADVDGWFTFKMLLDKVGNFCFLGNLNGETLCLGKLLTWKKY